MSYNYLSNKMYLKGIDFEIINTPKEVLRHQDGRSIGISQSRKVTFDALKILGATTNSLTWNQSAATITSNVNGVVASTVISDASPTNRGMVSTGTQSFAGNKTFTGNISVEGNTTIGNATTDRLTVTSQILGATPLVFQGATDNTFTQSFSFIEPTASNTSTFRNVNAQVAHTFHNPSFAMVIGTNTVTHNLNLTTPNAVIVQAFDTTTNQQVVLNMSAATANSFQFTSTVAGTIRITCIG